MPLLWPRQGPQPRREIVSVSAIPVFVSQAQPSRNLCNRWRNADLSFSQFSTANWHFGCAWRRVPGIVQDRVYREADFPTGARLKWREWLQTVLTDKKYILTENLQKTRKFYQIWHFKQETLALELWTSPARQTPIPVPQQASILTVPCPGVAVRFSFQSMSSDFLMPLSGSPSPSVKFKTAVILSLGAGRSSSACFRAPFFRISKSSWGVTCWSWQISNSKTSSASYVIIWWLVLVYWDWAKWSVTT